MAVDEGLHLLPNTKEVQGRVTIKVRRNLVNKTKEFGIPEDIAGDLRTVLQNVEGFEKLAKSVNEFSPDFQIGQKEYTILHLPHEVRQTPVREYGNSPVPSVEKPGQFDGNVDEGPFCSFRRNP